MLAGALQILQAQHTEAERDLRAALALNEARSIPSADGSTATPAPIGELLERAERLALAVSALEAI